MGGDIVGVSSFGLCNSLSHIILKQNKKTKTKIYEKGEMFNDGLPRLIFISGRNEECVKQSIEHIKNSTIDEEYAALLHSVFYKSLNAHYYRSFTIIPDTNEGSQEEIYVSIIEIIIIIIYMLLIKIILCIFTVSFSFNEKTDLVHIFWNGISME